MKQRKAKTLLAQQQSGLHARGACFLPTALLLPPPCEHFGAGAFNGVQVIRGVGYTCEEKAMWKLCLTFHLLLKLNATIRQVATHCTFC